MKSLAGTSKVALAVAAFLASLSLVSWRQGEALDTLRDLENLLQETAVEAGTQEELEGRIRILESRARVTREAEVRLGMRVAEGSDIVLMPVEDQ